MARLLAGFLQDELFQGAHFLNGSIEGVKGDAR